MASVRAPGRPLGLRGAGCSYGDAAMNSAGHVLDTRAMDRILSLGRATAGVIRSSRASRSASSGATPSATAGGRRSCPARCAVSVGGAAAMNIHGKNNFAVGTIGEHVESFVLSRRRGTLRCSRDENADLFHAAIGGFGMLGCFTEITLRLKRRALGPPARVGDARRSDLAAQPAAAGGASPTRRLPGRLDRSATAAARRSGAA